jgi:hypothetical protein
VIIAYKHNCNQTNGFFFWKNMTFGYCFSPYVARLAIVGMSWNPASYKKKLNGFFGYKLKGMEFH